MRTGSPGFIGRRLREAREVRCLTAKALAVLIGVSNAAISQYENGRQTPSPDILQLISVKLDVPKQFFFKPLPRLSNNTTFFRSLSSATLTARKSARWKLIWCSELVSYLEYYLDLPSRNLYRFQHITDPRIITQNDIEEAATACRRFWGLKDGVIPDLALLLENNGIVITRQSLDEEKLDGLSEPELDKTRDYVLLNSDKGSAVRSRFDLAHELGHLILHRHIDELTHEALYRQIENQANLFASAFLLPKTTFTKDFYTPTLDVFENLKAKWRVSIAAMIMRSFQLGLLDDQQHKAMHRKIRYRGWQKIEPLDNTLVPEYPRLLKRSIEVLFSSGIHSKESFLLEQTLGISDIEAICGLTSGFLENDNFAKIEYLPVRAKSAGERSSSSPANIHQLHK